VRCEALRLVVELGKQEKRGEDEVSNRDQGGGKRKEVTEDVKN
jgi:hypothetical protein